MTVGARLVDYILPDEINPNKPFFISITLETTGSGENFIFGGVMDAYVEDRARGWVTNEKLGPGVVGTMSGDFPPLVEWYERDFGRPIPDVLMWRAVCGWLDKRGSENPSDWVVHLTDQSPAKSIPVRVPPEEEEKEGILEWIKAHPMEIAAASGGLMIGMAVLTRK